MIDLDKLAEVREAVKGREIALIAATKTQTKQTIDDFMSLAPEFILGENRAQELVQKYDDRYKWHFIGRLQTNKVRYVVGKVELIHSLDRLELAKEIDRCAGKLSLVQPCLVEVNLGGESSKGGVGEDELYPLLDALAGYKNIDVQGLMCVMPNVGEGELEGLYARLEKLFDRVKRDFDGMRYLSAGMTNDYNLALRHGSNMIRLGRLLFGERTYKA